MYFGFFFFSASWEFSMAHRERHNKISKSSARYINIFNGLFITCLSESFCESIYIEIRALTSVTKNKHYVRWLFESGIYEKTYLIANANFWIS